MKLRNARYLSRDIIDELILPGDTVVDATMGNGHDTLYLAQKVGADGKVYAFDVQQAALDSTQKRLEENGCADGRAELILDSHANMTRYVQTAPKCVLFNLGWLPTGDHAITTQTHSTLQAVQAAMEIVQPGGMISVCIYPGHDEGTREKHALVEMLRRADIRKYNILWCDFINQREDSPKVVLIQKE